MKKQEFVQNEKFTSHLSNYLQLYLERCISSLSCNTVRRYYACLKLFDRYLTNIEWNSEKLDIEVFDSWVESLRPRKQSTIILHRTIIIQFLRFLSSLGFEVVMPEKIIDRTDYTPHIFTDHERELFFAKADNYIKTKSDNKYLRVIIPMAMRIIDCCGSREEETLSLKVEDLDFDMGCIAMKRTKGEKQRLVPVTPKLNEMLREYCIHMGIISTPDAYLFPGATADESLDPNIFRNHYRNILFRTDIKIMERGMFKCQRKKLLQ